MASIHFYKIKEGKKDTFKEWCIKLNTTLRNEAIDTLREENATREGFKLFEINGEYYAMGYMEGENIIPSNQERSINIEHRKIMKECIEKQIKGEDLYDLVA